MILRNLRSKAIVISEQFFQNIRLTWCQAIDLFFYSWKYISEVQLFEASSISDCYLPMPNKLGVLLEKIKCGSKIVTA